MERSYGEVLKPETINYRSYKPEKEGLFCEKIFGPIKDWECHCGKYKGIRYRGIVCDRCGVEVTRKNVRRERLGHITLAVPVVHIWFLKSIPSKLSYLLGFTTKQLESVTYYESYVIISPGNSGYSQGDLIDENTFLDLDEEYGLVGLCLSSSLYILSPNAGPYTSSVLTCINNTNLLYFTLHYTTYCIFPFIHVHASHGTGCL